jgi:hypothetical protein
LFQKVNLPVNRKLLFSLIVFLLGGLISGFLATSEYRTIPLAIKTIDKSRLKVFFLTFSQHYWLIVALWFMGLIPLGFLGSYALLFGKGFILGVTLGFILKAEALFGAYSFFKLLLWQFILLIPLTLYIAYFSVLISFYRLKFTNEKAEINLNSYLNRLLLASIVIVIYSFIMALSVKQIITP